MQYRIITPATEEPVDLDDAKLALRVDGDDEDPLIEAYIATARRLCEAYARRSLAVCTLEAAADTFPCDLEGAMELPMGPVSVVASVKYTDTAGAEQTMPSGNYVLDPYGDANRVTRAYNVVWPTVQCIANAVRVRYTAGYAELPECAETAILLTVAFLYENRGDQQVLDQATLPAEARAVLGPIKIWA